MTETKDKDQVLELDGRLPSTLALLNLYADWHPPCAAMNVTFSECSRMFPLLTYYQAQAEDFPELAEELEVSSVPTFLIVDGGKVIERLEGANAPALSALAEKYAKIASQRRGIQAPVSLSTSTGTQEARLRALVSSHPMMLFMKGVPTQPACGFSKQIVELLKSVNASYGSFDILSDDSVRQGLKELYEWPTYPQLYIHGELVGGLDILKELIATGEFQNMMPMEEDLPSRLKKLISRAPVMLFMKGSADAPKCGFSRQIVTLLQSEGVLFETFDILEDEQVRQGLKEFSEWPTYPQLYIKGELVGGLDIVKEMVANGDLKAML